MSLSRSSALPSRVGRMTAQMRAVTVVDNRPKVLRIAVVESGRIVLERVVREQRVTIGSREDATVVVAGASEQFVRRSDGWHLVLGPSATARVASGKGIVDATAGTDLLLSDDARGKVVLGRTTVLFQLVKPPPIATTPQLPLAVKGGLLERVDWSLTMVAALSFLAHFGIVGAMYSDWLDPVVTTDHEVAGLVDMMNRLPETKIETHDEAVTPGPVASATPTAKATPSSTPGARAPSSPSTRRTTPTTTSTAISDADANLLADRADAMELGIVSAANAPTSVEGALRRSEIPPVDMSAAAASQEGAARSASDLRLAKDGAQAAHSKDLSSLAPGARADANHTAGNEADKPPPPIANLDLRPPSASMPISDADVVVAGLRGRFRKCYQDGLAGDPTMQGKAVIVATVAPNGEVQSTSVAENSGLSPKVTSCVASAVSRATFKGNGGITTVRIPVSFFHQ